MPERIAAGSSPSALPRSAVEPLTKARDLLTSALGADHEFTALVYEEEGYCALAAKDFALAAGLLERAIASYAHKIHVKGSRAEALFGLGKAKLGIRAKRGQAKAHVQEALGIWGTIADHDPKLSAEAAAWLASH